MTCTEVIMIAAELEEVQNNLITARNDFSEMAEMQIKNYGMLIDRIEATLHKYLRGESKRQYIHYEAENIGSRDWLKEIRQAKKMTQKQVAELSGITDGYYNMIEVGVRGNPLPVDKAKKIAAALGFEWELFYQEG